MGALRLLFGTTNPGKLRELRRLVAGLPVEVVSPDDLGRTPPEVEEDGATFQANAEKKASAWARWSGLHALADDSGLRVDALGGAPGVHSARWSDLDPGGPASPVCELAGAAAVELGPVAGRAARDERNNDKLLASLAGVPDARRGARYEAVLVVASPDGARLATVTGVCRGRIGHARRGTGGFGYDPLFVPETELARAACEPGSSARTMAELPAEEKDAISHRGSAFRQILPVLERLARARGA
ncbi:non-canonical purine NTP pyrophosphatase [Anaeromyxobacter oryzisoli]|uniref:non-canonical purine NTP pyrophosphatase n=1 Tax=Anaeromyxobacter oryzisoli TaxID=2925408 RepID=UPI001F5622A9|nr:non-canonical purine NTP pyrophosphatase [Anaeromyxobacter sp. SG63]